MHEEIIEGCSGKEAAGRRSGCPLDSPLKDDDSIRSERLFHRREETWAILLPPLPPCSLSSSFRVAFASPGEVEGKMEIRGLEGSGTMREISSKFQLERWEILKIYTVDRRFRFVLLSSYLCTLCLKRSFSFSFFSLVSSETSSVDRFISTYVYQYFMDIETKFIEYVCSFQDVKRLYIEEWICLKISSLKYNRF